MLSAMEQRSRQEEPAEDHPVSVRHVGFFNLLAVQVGAVPAAEVLDDTPPAGD